MSEATTDHEERPLNRDEELSGLFAQMVLQQSNMAMMLLGKIPHPHTGQTTKDLEAARMFIDQLEMIEAKTKGNLSKEEDGLLKHTLMTLRLSFVEAVETPAPAEANNPTNAPPPAEAPSVTPPPGAEEESKKKFTKKY